MNETGKQRRGLGGCFKIRGRRASDFRFLACISSSAFFTRQNVSCDSIYRRLSAKSKDLVTQPLHLDLLLDGDSPQPLTELGIIHALSMLGELHDILSF